jgi:type II secretory ATPase GspE/PulE/Tfp pilus assembly ATPase PilB-like protein
MVREFFGRRPDTLVFKKGAGCPRCNYSGYRGRMTIVELWTPDDEDVLAITKHASFDEMKASAQRSTLPMRDAMWVALESGQTNLEELVRVMPASTIADFRHHFPRRVTAASA